MASIALSTTEWVWISIGIGNPRSSQEKTCYPSYGCGKSKPSHTSSPEVWQMLHNIMLLFFYWFVIRDLAFSGAAERVQALFTNVCIQTNTSDAGLIMDLLFKVDSLICKDVAPFESVLEPRVHWYYLLGQCYRQCMTCYINYTNIIQLLHSEIAIQVPWHAWTHLHITVVNPRRSTLGQGLAVAPLQFWVLCIVELGFLSVITMNHIIE